MTIKIKIPKAGGDEGRRIRGLPRDPVVRAALIVFLIIAVSFTVFFSYFYIKYDRIIETALPESQFSLIRPRFMRCPRSYARARRSRPRYRSPICSSAGIFATRIDRSKLGTFQLVKDGIEITPGRGVVPQPRAGDDQHSRREVDQHQQQRGTELSAYELEPQLVTALFDAEQRSKREVVKYNDIPPVMVQAVLAIEDRRFFEHSGVNFAPHGLKPSGNDVLRAAARAGRIDADHATARGFFLTPEKTIKRKITEMLIAEELERKFTKQQIFEFYANWVTWGSGDRLPSADLPRPRRLTSIKT